MADWLVKVRRQPTGLSASPTSIVDSYESRDMAEFKATEMNRAYQTDTYYVEAFDPARVSVWTPTSELTDVELFPKW